MKRKRLTIEHLRRYMQHHEIDIATTPFGEVMVCASMPESCDGCILSEIDSSFIHTLNEEAEEYLRTKYPEYFI